MADSWSEEAFDMSFDLDPAQEEEHLTTPVSNTVVKESFNVAPNLAAKAKKYGKQFGLSPDIVTGDMDSFEALDLARRINTLPESSRGFAERNLSVVRNDIDQLGEMEGFWGSMGRGVDMMQSTLHGFVEATGEATGIDALQEAGKQGREVNERQMAQYGDKQSFTEIEGVGDVATWVSQTAGEQIPMMTPTIGGAVGGAAIGSVVPGIGTAVGGAVGAFVPSYMMAVGEIQGGIKGKVPDAIAPLIAFSAGVPVALLDIVLPGRVGSSIAGSFGVEMGSEVAERVIKQTLTETAKRVSVAVAKGSGLEGLTEAAQEAIQEVAASYAVGQDVDTKELGKIMIEAFAAGALMGGTISGATEYGTGKMKSARAKSRTDTLRKLNNLDMEVREHSPEVYAQAQAENMRKQGIEGVNIDSDGVKILNQDFEDLDIFDEEDSNESSVSGVSLNVDPEKFWSLPQEAIESIAEYVTFSETELSESQSLEADEFLKKYGAPPTQEELAKEAASITPENKVFARMYDQRIASGKTMDAARKEAQNVAAFFGVLGGRVGIDPWEMFQDTGLEIRKELPGSYSSYKPDQQDYLIDTAKRVSGSDVSDQSLYGESLIEFISNRGGIIDTGGDLISMNLELWHKEKAFRKKAIREAVGTAKDMFGKKSEDGLDFTPDYVREAAVEAGYLSEDASIDDLYEAVRTELSGSPQYILHNADEQAIAEMEAVDDLIEYMYRNEIDVDQDTRVIKAQLEAVQRLREDDENIYNQQNTNITKDDPIFSIPKKELEGKEIKLPDENGNEHVVDAKKAVTVMRQKFNQVKSLVDCVNGV